MNLERLLKENVAQAEPVEYYPSKRLTEEDGSVQTWIIRPLTNKEVDAINARNTEKVINPKTRRLEEKTDIKKVGREVVLSALIDPSQADLEQGTVQDSWGVTTPWGVLEAMLLPGELTALSEKVQEISGFDAIAFNAAVEDAEKK